MTRRDNGLPGGPWSRLVDLEPPVADHVLEVLRDEGIAAYAAPATEVTGPYLETRAHPRPLDHVFVGRGEEDAARAVIDRLLPDLRAELAAEDERPSGRLADRVSTDEDVWAGIVAAYSAPAADPVGRWSASEDGDPPAARAEDTTAAPEAGATPTHPGEGAPTSSTASGFEDIRAELDALREAQERSGAAPGPAEDPTDHYVPPPPPPLPESDPITRAAWVGILGGPLFLILATLLGWGPGGIPGFLAVMAFVGGFVTLVSRMGDERDHDGDDGAVV